MDDSNSSLSIDTPDNILLDAEIAGFGTRCIAAIIDYTILIVLSIGVAILFVRAARPSGDTGLYGLMALVQFGIITFYHLLFELFWNGQTPGKRATRIRVVQANGLPVTASSAIIRNLVRLFDFLPILYGLGLLVMFATKHTQRLGDLAARTVVIHERGRLTAKAVKEDLSVPYLYIRPIEPIPPYIQIERLTPADHRMVIDYLQRRAQMQDRSSIAFLVARQIAAKMDDPGIAHELYGLERPERFLEFVARAFEIAARTTD